VETWMSVKPETIMELAGGTTFDEDAGKQGS
jgi:hypothetical protein